MITKNRFEHQNHHPACPNNEDIDKIAFHGDHFEIQDGRHRTRSKNGTKAIFVPWVRLVWTKENFGYKNAAEIYKISARFKLGGGGGRGDGKAI